MVCKFADGTYYQLCYMVALWQNDDFTYTYPLSILSSRYNLIPLRIP